MINHFLNEYGNQKQIFKHEKEILDTTSKSIKVLSKNEEILRSRLVKTFLKRHPKTQKLTKYNFDPKEFKQFLMIYDTVLPSIITQNNSSDFIMVFESDNQTAAFLEGIYYIL